MFFEHLVNDTAVVLGTQLHRGCDSCFFFFLAHASITGEFFIKLFGNVLEYKEENTNHCSVVSTLIPHPHFTETFFNKFINELQVDKSNWYLLNINHICFFSSIFSLFTIPLFLNHPPLAFLTSLSLGFPPIFWAI